MTVAPVIFSMNTETIHPSITNRWRQELPAWLAGGACATITISIAVSQILLAASVLAILFRRDHKRGRERGMLPATWAWPLLGFILWTALSLAFSDAPLAGLSQIKKLVLLAVIPITYTAFTRASQVDWTLRATLLTGTASAGWGLIQFVGDYRYIAAQNLPFYENYITHQITGFMSHWMTYGGQLMLLIMGVAAMIFFRQGGQRAWALIGFSLTSTALLAAFTRGAWLGALVGFSYLVYSYRKWLVPLIPAGLLILYLAAPDALRKREQSIVEPGSDSSIQSRLVMARTGLAMIVAHPLFGVGPERVAPMFERYRPAGITLPPAWYGHLHNSFIHFAAERGLPALAFFVWLIVVILRANYRLTSARNAATAALARTAVAATLGMIVLGAFEYNFGDSEVLMLYLFFVTLPLAASRLELDDIKTEPRP
ncbi:MAG: O-antigen ligase family protein [Acidobacteria bacterium]|nr:O-antigen ligase family protein [Acidobacteriota bacterium]